MKKILIAILVVQISIVFASFSFKSSSAGMQMNFFNYEGVNSEEVVSTIVAYPALDLVPEIVECEIDIYSRNGDLIRSENNANVRVEVVESFVMREMYAHKINLHLKDYSDDYTRVISSVKLNLSSSSRVTVPDKISPAFLPSYKKLAANFNESYLRDLPLEDLRLHIIVQADWEHYLEPLVKWKNARGIATSVSTFDEAGYTTESIKQHIQTLYESDTPPTYLILVGDMDEPCNIPTYYKGPLLDAADLPYTLHAGDDYYPEMIIGRFSVDYEFEMGVVVNKILYYEKEPYMSNTAWFKKAMLIAGNYSTSWPIPQTPVNVSRWLKEKLLNFGYNEVEEIYYPGVYPGTPEIISGFNSGVNLVSYRGWGDSNGWHFPDFKEDDVDDLNNGYQLPVVASFVCNTGDFASDDVDPNFGEKLLRVGTPDVPQGCVSFIGPSYEKTKTKYNNCLFTGYFTGILDEGIHTLGDAVMRAKTELTLNYPHELEEDGMIEFYYNIYNIIGDPSLMMWTDIPAEISCELPESVEVGSNHISFELAGLDGAIVTAFKEDEFINKTVVENGEAVIFLNSQTSGEIEITITKPNYKPFMGMVQVMETGVELILDAGSIEQLISGGTAEIEISLQNIGASDAASVTGMLSSENPYITIIETNLSFGDIGAGNSVTLNAEIEISELCPDRHNVMFTLDLGDYGTRKFQLTVSGMMLEITSIVFAGDGFLDPGEADEIFVEISNISCFGIEGLEVNAITFSDAVEVSDASSVIGSIPIGSSGTASFSASAEDDCFVGRNFTVKFVFTDSEGRVCDLSEILTVGQVTASDPTGPDNYGYFAYDSNDTEYEEAPTYSWYEIDPGLGGDGTEVALGDDASTTIDIPFDFQYYGNSYDSLTVCSNGWASFQTTWFMDYINWKIPNVLGPYAMVAPFWDDLTGTVTYEGPEQYEVHADMKIVYNYYEDEGVFVVLWTDCFSNYDNVSVEKFQLVLFDPAVYDTSTGDGEFQFNYNEIVDNDISNNFCTVGIENPTQSDGISYVYSTIYAPSATPLQNGLAIKFTTNAPDAYVNSGNSDVNDISTNLLQNYPNPFNPTTKISYELKKNSAVELTIYNSKGQVVKKIVDAEQKAGKYAIGWNGNDNCNVSVSSGVYFYRLKTDSNAITKKMILIK